MDRRPIGVFDSGLGGLTAMREFIRLMPGEELVYFGDTGRVPYGGRSRDTIIQYARQDVAFLRTFDPKAIVIACGTASTTALNTLRVENTIPIFGVVDPAAASAAAATRNKQVGLIGTKASIRSGAYEMAISRYDPDIQVTALACPLLVPLVENGRFRPGDKVVELVVEEYMAPMKAAGVDTLVLGCTHYPLLREVIARSLGDQVTLIDTGAACARAVCTELEEGGLLTDRPAPGRRRYYTSDDAGDFSTLAALFLGAETGLAAERVNIASY